MPSKRKAVVKKPKRPRRTWLPKPGDVVVVTELAPEEIGWPEVTRFRIGELRTVEVNTRADEEAGRGRFYLTSTRGQSVYGDVRKATPAEEAAWRLSNGG